MYRLVVILIIASCHQGFYKQKPTISAALLPSSCAELYQFLQNDWQKHRSRNCHFYELKHLQIKQNYSNCLIGLSKSQIIGMFGKPDVLNGDKYQYNLHKTCSKGVKGHFYLSFIFDFEKVTSIDSGYTSWEE